MRHCSIVSICKDPKIHFAKKFIILSTECLPMR